MQIVKTKPYKNFLLAIILAMLPLSLLQGQTPISGIINDYKEVTTVDNGSSDNVTVLDATGLSPGDTVLLVQMKGATIASENLARDSENFGTVQNQLEAGKYEFLIIQNIVTNTVTFTTQFTNPYDENERVQLIRVPTYKNARVTADLTSTSWDGSTGGVLAVFVTDTLTLDADINVNGKGFRGGDAVQTNGICGEGNPLFQYYSYTITSDTASYKGEGIVRFDDNHRKGRGKWANGGGGGNASNAGGGGAGNYTSGGYGGREIASCGISDSTAGIFGSLPASFYVATEHRVSLGGGGGAGSYTTGRSGSNGGNGGGIVFIIADKVVGNGNSIMANGASVTGVVDGGAGAGGAGGNILLAVEQIENINIQANGGNGGSTNGVEETGPGGGGGSGIIWYLSSTTPVSVTESVNGGINGGHIPTGGNPFGATSGANGGSFSNLELVLTGFLGNSIKDNQLICSGEIPLALYGLPLKGGTAPYTFQWEQSSDKLAWSNASTAGGPNDQPAYQPPALTDTMYYRRVVTDMGGAGMVDRGNIITIAVVSQISLNDILQNDTTCGGETPIPFTGAIITGGYGDTTYTWQQRTESGTWGGASGINDQKDYIPVALNQTYYFRRIVSRGCINQSTSNEIKVEVHPNIGNNIITGEDIICYNDRPLSLGGSIITGGFNDTTYTWEQSIDQNNWSAATGINNLRDYSPQELTQTTYYKRTVDRNCLITSESNVVSIEVLPSITNNLLPADQVVCYNTIPALFQATTPLGGDGNYLYLWQQSPDNVNWADAGGNNQVEDFQAGNISDVTYFRRIVYSGQNDCCIDTSSNSVQIDIYDLPTGIVQNTIDTVCEGADSEISLNLTGQPPFDFVLTDGTNDFTFTGISSLSPDVSITPLLTQSISLETLIDDHGCEATDKSGVANIAVYQVPVAGAGNDDEVCLLDYTLDASADIGTGEWSVLPGEGTIQDVNDPVSSVRMDRYGTFTFTWKVTNWECEDSDEVQITFYEMPTGADAGEDQTLKPYVFETALSANTPLVGMGKWEIADSEGSIDNEQSPLSTVSGLNFGENIFTWTITNGVCPESTDEVLITVKPLVVPTAFSPNGDNKNDFFVIEGLENIENELIIFNKRGMEILRTLNYQNDWEGILTNGKKLPTDTYFYILKIDDGTIYKGFIYLKTNDK